MPDDTVKLLLCPFCMVDGAETERTITGAWAVVCGSDGCLGSGPVADTEAEAITAWNTRAALSASPEDAEQSSQAQIAAMREAGQAIVNRADLASRAGYSANQGITDEMIENLRAALSTLGSQS